jgi:hypothetical protein
MKRPKLPKEQFRDVPVLFPTVVAPVTEAQLARYRRIAAEHGPYAFCVDRQSEEEELKRKAATGQFRRVEAIRQFARVAGCWIPEPVARADRQEGELAFSFDRDFWFVDGEEKHATGYTASQNARPEFWRAYLLAQALAEQQCAPAAFLVGEGTRLFRDTAWLETFYRSLKDAGVRVFVGNYGEITDQTLPGLQAMIRALSSWLPEALKGARKARRENGEVFSPGNIHFGLRVDPEDARIVHAHPDEWPLLAQLVEELAEARLRSLLEGLEWLERHGIKRSIGWLYTLLFKRPILDGTYDTDATWGQVRKLRQRPFTDLDIRPNGDRRYLRHQKEALLIPIRFGPGCEPIPPELLALARQRIRGRRRTGEKEPPAGHWISGRFTRCAVCGQAVDERLRHRPQPHWDLVCLCANTLRMRHGISRRAADDFEECQHVRYRPLDEPLSAKVWRLIVGEVEARPLNPDLLPIEEEADEERRLRAEVVRLDAELETLIANMGQLRLNGANQERFQRRCDQLSEAVESRQRQLNTLTTRMIERRQRNESLSNLRSLLRRFNCRLADAEKRELIEEIVARIDVHLEEGWFEVHVDTTLPGLARLHGSLGGENFTYSPKSEIFTDLDRFRLKLKGTLDLAA